MTIDCLQLKNEIIIPTLAKLKLNSDAAVNLILGTAAQESHLGTYIKQIKGPALGIYQIEPATHIDLYKNYLNYRDSLKKKVQSFLIDGLTMDENLVGNLYYSTALCRIVYFRVKEKLPLPSNISALGEYWKIYYNTCEGSGTVSDFIKNYIKYIQ